jgi:isochorismate synthase
MKTGPLPTSTTKADYISLVNEIKQKATKGYFTKAVAARVSIEIAPPNFDAVLFFEELCHVYPNAFVSLVYTPKTGLWIGATPEVLLICTKSKFITYSLAGTKANTSLNRKKSWGEKEKIEQEIVSQYIHKVFKSITRNKALLKGPETIQAANLLHLRTTFTYNKVSVKQWNKVARKLHPTPAVAGLPKKKAIDFIQSHEKNKRDYYSGYLGYVNKDSNASLFVNLRCMKVQEGKLIIYTGCGITKDSIPTNEWKETEIKKQTLLRVVSRLYDLGKVK